jgi:uncharacterized protein
MVHAVVFYHAGCDDGFGAAWAAWKRFGEAALYQPMQYGDPVPTWAQVLPLTVPFYVVDFSFPRPILQEWRTQGRSFTVLDHHKTAMDDLVGLEGCVFDMTQSGAVLTWKHFHLDEPVPTLLEYVQDRDLWAKQLPQTDEHSAGLRSHPRDFHVWDALAGEGWPSLIEDGKAILRYQRQQVQDMCERMVWLTIGGCRVPAVNATVLFSEVAHQLVTDYAACAEFAAYYFDRPDGKRQWGLRANRTFDVSEVAKRYGGGGHRGAAGFVTERAWLGDGA